MRLKHGRSLGLLDGIPVAWKDLFDIGGLPTTAGSKVLADASPAGADAAVVDRLRCAGMVTIGRVNMSEFAFSGIGINPNYGTPHNPASADVPRIPGGSSSGSAVAVARSLVPVSIGTDTGGSVRIPAALNGIVGYKATSGRYPMNGVFPLARSLDSLGPLCRCVADAILVDAAMCGLAVPNIVRTKGEGQAIVVPTNVVLDGIEPAVLSAFEAVLDSLAAIGVRIERKAIPAFDRIFELTDRYGPLVSAEAFALHQDRLTAEAAAGIDPRVVARIRLGSRTSMPDYIAMLQERAQLIGEVGRTFGADTLFAFPTVPHIAPPIASLTTDDDLFFKVNAKTLRNTLIGNFLDWCGVSIPCGTGAAGMPVGFLLSALPGEDERLLAFSLFVESVINGRNGRITP